MGGRTVGTGKARQAIGKAGDGEGLAQDRIGTVGDEELYIFREDIARETDDGNPAT